MHYCLLALFVNFLCGCSWRDTQRRERIYREYGVPESLYAEATPDERTQMKIRPHQRLEEVERIRQSSLAVPKKVPVKPAPTSSLPFDSSPKLRPPLRLGYVFGAALSPALASQSSNYEKCHKVIKGVRACKGA